MRHGVKIQITIDTAETPGSALTQQQQQIKPVSQIAAVFVAENLQAPVAVAECVKQLDSFIERHFGPVVLRDASEEE